MATAENTGARVRRQDLRQLSEGATQLGAAGVDRVRSSRRGFLAGALVSAAAGVGLDELVRRVGGEEFHLFVGDPGELWGRGLKRMPDGTFAHVEQPLLQKVTYRPISDGMALPHGFKLSRDERKALERQQGGVPLFPEPRVTNDPNRVVVDPTVLTGALSQGELVTGEPYVILRVKAPAKPGGPSTVTLEHGSVPVAMRTGLVGPVLETDYDGDVGVYLKVPAAEAGIDFKTAQTGDRVKAADLYVPLVYAASLKDVPPTEPKVKASPVPQRSAAPKASTTPHK